MIPKFIQDGLYWIRKFRGIPIPLSIELDCDPVVEVSELPFAVSGRVIGDSLQDLVVNWYCYQTGVKYDDVRPDVNGAFSFEVTPNGPESLITLTVAGRDGQVASNGVVLLYTPPE